MQTRHLISALLAATLSGALAVPAVQAQSSLSARVDRIERLMSQQRLSEMVLQMQQMQQEISELRGQVELQQYQLQQLMTGQAGPDSADLGMMSGQEDAGGAAPDGLILGPAMGTSDGGLVLSSDAAEAEPAVDPVAEEKAYRSAFELLKDRDYPAAKSAFEAVLVDHPNGRYTDNSIYWLGEIAYVTKDHAAAIADFSRLIERYPDSNKRPSALLKLGYLYDESGDTTQARALLEQLIAAYPNSTEARLAGARLERLD